MFVKYYGVDKKKSKQILIKFHQIIVIVIF